ncbi:MAG: FecR domain-containing protein [Planctomycetota bacterium]|nr:FecR domain-containing protein [Planctomycetota bacterium]
MRDDPERLNELRALLRLDDHLHQVLHAERTPEAFLRGLAERQRVPPASGPVVRRRRRVRRRSSHRRAWLGAGATVAVAAAAAVVLLMLLPAQSEALPEAQPQAWSVQIVPQQGQVALLRAGQRQLLSAGQRGQAEDRVVTGPAGRCALRFADGSRLQLGPDAQLVLAPKGPPAGVQALLHAGTVDAHIAPQTGSQRFSVATELATVSVLGTQFQLRAELTVSRLSVREGRVRFSDDHGAALELGPGQAALCTEQQGGASLRAIDLTGGLVAHWPINEGAGDTVSGPGPTPIAPIHAAQWVGPDLPGGPGLAFDGPNSYLEIPLSPALAAIPGQAYTITARYRPKVLPQANAAGADMHFIVGRMGWGLGLHLKSSGAFMMQHFRVDSEGHHSCDANSEPGFSAGRTYALAGVVDVIRGLTELYVDGKLADQRHWPAGAEGHRYGTDPWYIGIHRPPATDTRWPAHGVISQVRIYSRALDADAIQAITSQDAPSAE